MADYALSEYVRKSVIESLYNGVAFPSLPTAWYVSLHTAEPTLTGGNEHTATNGYARKVFTPLADDGTPDYIVVNDGNIEFAPATGSDWTQVTYFGVFDAVTAGNFLGYGILTTARTVLVDGVFRFLDGDLSIQMV